MTKTKWIRGALLVAAMTGCQADAITNGDPKDDGASDISDALAQLPEANVLQYSADGVPQFLTGDLGRVDMSTANLVANDDALRAAMPALLKAFRLEPKDLVLRKVNSDEMGSKHYRYSQTRDGLPVVGSDLIVHVDHKGSIFAVNGNARGDFPASLTAPSVTEGAANLAIASDTRWAGIAGRQVTSSRTVYIQTQDGSLHKALEQVVEGIRGQDPVRDKVYVDAQSGQILEVHPTIHFAKNRATYNLNGGTSLPGTLARSEGQASVSDANVNAAHDNVGDVYDVYKNTFNRDSYNNAGAQLKSSVHYSTNYCNAFWNSTQMVYGDGSASQGCSNLTAIDVVGHEMTHAVTENESNLTYSGESGGLNESLSDIGGAMTESWVLGGRTGTFSTDPKVFLIGDLTIAPFLRNMCDPAADGASADVWSSSIGGIDVHYSSGPNNLAWCLAAKGGTHPRGKTTNMVPSVGIAKAFSAWYVANRDFLTASSNYAAARNAVGQAAAALGYSTAEQDAFACAFAAIKVGTAPAACGGTPPPPDTVLTNGVPVTNQSDSTAGNFKYYSLVVPSGQTTATFTISGGTGDADMYVSAGVKPTETSYQCRPYLGGNAETCTFSPPTAGTYYVGVRAYAAYTGLTVTGSYSTTGGGSCGTDPALSNNVPVSNLSGAASSAAYWCLPNVPTGRTLTIKISGGTGDADLYTRSGSRPTTTTYNCRPYLSGNTETCTTTTTAAANWYVMLRGFSAFSGVTLIGSY